MCPAVNVVDDSDAICSGTLMMELSSWQMDVANDGMNNTAIADVNTGGSVLYSSVPVDGVVVTVPDGIIDGIIEENC